MAHSSAAVFCKLSDIAEARSRISTTSRTHVSTTCPSSSSSTVLVLPCCVLSISSRVTEKPLLDNASCLYAFCEDRIQDLHFRMDAADCGGNKTEPWREAGRMYAWILKTNDKRQHVVGQWPMGPAREMMENKTLAYV